MRTRATRRFAALLTIAALALAGIAVPVAAQPGGGHGGHGGHGKSEQSDNGDRGRSRKPAKVSRFAAVGFVEAVDTDLVVMEVKGGLRGLKGESIDVTVADDARIKVDGERATLADVEPGMHVVVKGVRSGPRDAVVFAAQRLFAHTPDDDEDEHDHDS